MSKKTIFVFAAFSCLWATGAAQTATLHLATKGSYTGEVSVQFDFFHGKDTPHPFLSVKGHKVNFASGKGLATVSLDMAPGSSDLAQINSSKTMWVEAKETRLEPKRILLALMDGNWYPSSVETQTGGGNNQNTTPGTKVEATFQDMFAEVKPKGDEKKQYVPISKDQAQQMIKHSLSRSDSFLNYIGIYGATIATGASIKPYVTLQGIWGRQKLKVKYREAADKDSQEKFYEVPMDRSFVNKFWNLIPSDYYHGIERNCRFYGVLGFSTGTLMTSESTLPKEASVTSVFVGAGYAFSPYATLNLGISFHEYRSSVRGLLGFGVSIDPSILGTLFSGK